MLRRVLFKNRFDNAFGNGNLCQQHSLSPAVRHFCDKLVQAHFNRFHEADIVLRNKLPQRTSRLFGGRTGDPIPHRVIKIAIVGHVGAVNPQYFIGEKLHEAIAQALVGLYIGRHGSGRAFHIRPD